ncbi:uncharacterized protein LOC130995846 [Salvia miltiorrhiza]|uniref:uncharacterized protein LOC130995846 n=1 Tax=Salvia miltiorrhiza TaxID=226208 RepID=UPI0025AD1E27|nr:uncharacterized protein LOC130995846 [Salvia miltiorrhiza]XP_057777284.1 uncharacterized protein LOC130995846 [Salvia miltiorrhiza]XP_057777291.1 uncharacterized protein LOC130995846 [Salvia miltiorrhiza]XP_057777301.1 uncharacterized protein LOC130995846 [Salvia miltiorrhiza]
MVSIGGGSSMATILLIVTISMALNFTLLAALPILSSSSQSGRLLAETSNGSNLDDTVRVDPLDGFKKYRGGYDITDKNYWSSTAFTGIYGYSIAAVWLLCGVLYGGFLLVRSCCLKGRRNLKKKRQLCHKNCYVLPLLLAVVFTLLAILGIGLALGGNAKFHARAKTVIDIIIDTADEASDTIYNTTGAMREMSITLEAVDADPEATRFLSETSQRLDAQANDIARQASKNRRLIDKVLKIVYIITTVTVSLTLVAVIALLALGILKFPRTVQVLIAICWILTVLCWLFFGIYFFLENFSKDTCTALESFQKDPYNNSLSSILPCDELLSAKSVLDDVSAGIYDLVNEVNNNISTSYGNIVQICNPFSPPPLYEYQPWTCPSSSIQIGDIPRVLRLLVCPDSEGPTCNGGIVVAASEYYTIEAYTTSIQKLLDVYPGMEALVECETVELAFAEILQNECAPLKRYAKMVWAALLFLSLTMVSLVLVWTAGAHHQRSRHSFGGSVKPHSIDLHDTVDGKPNLDV